MKRISFLLCSLFLCGQLIGQTLQDAIRYSTTNVGGTARTVGVGGAFGALGADFAVISINPAGLGMYRTSELVLTPTIYMARSEAELLGSANTEVDSKFNFNMNNVGVVFQNDSNTNTNNWVSSAFAIGYNRVANFHQEAYFEGSTPGTYLDRFVEQSFDIDTDQMNEFESALAFETGALYRTNPDDNTTWTNDYQITGSSAIPLSKKQSISREGAIDEMVFAYGGNLSNRFMIGATVGIPFISYKETKIYEEDDLDDEVAFFNEYRYEETLETSGVGINFKLGLIYRITQMFRLGVAVHSPTGMTLNDSYKATMRYDFTTDNSNGALEEESPDGIFDYGLRTPWKAIVSGAAIIGKQGFISADVEYLDYKNAKFNFTKDFTDADTQAIEDEINEDIDARLTNALNIRLGGEFAIEQFRVRAGLGVTGSSVEGSDLEANNSISAGLGYRLENFYVDAAYRRDSRNENYVPYRMFDPSQGQNVDIKQKSNKIMLTFGFKF